MARRILELRINMWIGAKPGPIYDWANQDNIFSRFTCYYPTDKPPVITLLSFIAGNNPISLDDHIIVLREQIRRETARIWEQVDWQHSCLQSEGGVDINKILPSETGRDVRVEDLAHVMAHILLVLFMGFRYPWISFEKLQETDFHFQELVYLNKHNQNEAMVAFNFLPRVLVGLYLDKLLDFVDQWLRGEETTTFWEVIQEIDTFLDRMFPVPKPR